MSTESEKTGHPNIDLASRSRVIGHLGTLGIKVAKTIGVADAVTKLLAHYKSAHDAGDAMAICERCGGMGPHAAPDCPFCGEANGDPESSSMVESSSIAESSTSLALREEQLAPVVQKGSILARPQQIVPRSVKKGTEDDLEVAVGNIQRFKRTFSENSWDIGHELNLIETESKERPALWRLRKDDGETKPAYDSFRAFLRAECGFSLRMAKTLQFIASTYSRDQVTLSGTAKIEIVLSAPAHEHAALLKSAPTTPLRQLRSKVQALNLASGRGEAQRKGKATLAAKKSKEQPALPGTTTETPAPAGTEAPAAPAPSGTTKAEKPATPAATENGALTVVLGKLKGKIVLYRKQPDAKGKLTPAHSVTDATGWLEGISGARIAFTVEKHPTTKNLVLVFEAKRAE